MTDVRTPTPSTGTEEHQAVPAVDPAPEGTDAPPARRRSALGLAVAVVVALALAAGIAVVAATSGGPSPVEVQVPAGTGERLDGGGTVEVVPAVLRLEPGQAVEVENDDVRLHVLGELRADPGETVRLTFPNEGRYLVSTSLRSDGRTTLLVEDPDAEEPASGG